MPARAPRPLKRGLSQLLTPEALRTLVRRPGWFAAQVAQGPSWLLDRRRTLDRAIVAGLLVTPGQAVAEATGATAAEAEAALADVWRPARDPAEPLTAWGARDVVLDVVGALVRVVRPTTVVETGVALGFSSATILAALEANDHGRLHSIDLPAPQWNPDREVGELVPAGLRHRWTLELGPSQRLLPRALARLGPVDVFLHDSNHAYSAQLREYRVAWPALRPGGILVTDDVWSPAFLEHAAAVGARPLLVEKVPGGPAFGLARRP